MPRVTKLTAAAICATALAAVPSMALAATSPAPAAHTHTRAPARPVSAPVSRPGVVVVRSGQRLELGGGYQMWLTSDTVTTEGPDGTPQTHPVDLANQPSGVSEQIDDQLVSGVYVGGGSPTWATVTYQGTTQTGPVVTLAGNPGWASFHVMLPHPLTNPQDIPTITIFGATGTTLATFPTTTTTPQH